MDRTTKGTRSQPSAPLEREVSETVIQMVKKRRRSRPRWLSKKDPVAAKRREGAKKRRREQRERGYDFVSLDAAGGWETVSARLDGSNPDVVVKMCLLRFRRRLKRKPRAGELLDCSLSFLGSSGRGAHALRYRNCWTFAFPRPAGAQPSSHSGQQGDIEEFKLKLRGRKASLGAQRPAWARFLPTLEREKREIAAFRLKLRERSSRGERI
jgi:hypothetical protein